MKFNVKMANEFPSHRRAVTRFTPGGRRYFLFNGQYLTLDDTIEGHAADIEFFRKAGDYEVTPVEESVPAPSVQSPIPAPVPFIAPKATGVSKPKKGGTKT